MGFNGRAWLAEPGVSRDCERSPLCLWIDIVMSVLLDIYTTKFLETHSIVIMEVQ